MDKLWNLVNMRDSYLTHTNSTSSNSPKQQEIINKFDELILAELNTTDTTTKDTANNG